MQYANIISLIDAYMERLLKARRILTELDLPVSRRELLTPIANRTARSKSTKRRNTLRKTTKSAIQKQYAERVSIASTDERNASPNAVSGYHQEAIALSKSATQGIEGRVSKETISTLRSRRTQPSQKKPVAQKPPLKPVAMALSGNIPTGPIVVQAEQIRYEQSLRQRETAMKTKGLFTTAGDVPLTAELLAKRWMQGKHEPARKIVT
jgi:RNase P/RNase MRP subunit p29